MKRRKMITLSAAMLAGGGLLAATRWWFPPGDDQEGTSVSTSTPPGKAAHDLQSRYQFVQLSDPDRTIVTTPEGGNIADLTHGARTAVFLTGGQRTFVEPQTTKARIVTSSRVRVAQEQFHPDMLQTEKFAAWLLAQIGSTEPDVLSAACDYITGVPDRTDGHGVKIIGDAGFGLTGPHSDRDGADFFDYLGIPWRWTDGKTTAPSAQFNRDLDCSGFIRLVYGYRMGMTLYRTNGYVDGLPRSAYAMADHAPSVAVASPARPDEVPRDLSRVRAGDLVFFALHDDNPAVITHSGIVLGPDTDGALRFVSSRGTVDGPTFGDVRGAGVINSGYFGDRLRRAIRL